MKKYLSILLAGLISLPLWAADLPGYYPGLFSVMGTLDRLSPDSHIVVIGDQRLKLQGQVLVHTQDTRYGTLSLLHNGMHVGVNPDRHGNVREIWILPADFKPTMNVIPLGK